MLGRTRRVHFVGVGGIGMSGIAELLANLGYEVSGSDAKRSDVTTRLETLGVTISEGHDGAHVGTADVVVVSSAIGRDNPEVVEARARHVPVIPRAEMLAELMRLRYGIAIAGAHGKTTTTSMVALVLDRAGLDPTAVIGGRLSAFGSNARLGTGDYMVAEADESDRSFLKLSPAIAVITNIDREHMESYGTWENLQEAFADFANKVPFYGTVIACADDTPVRDLLPRLTRRVITYGIEEPGPSPSHMDTSDLAPGTTQESTSPVSTSPVSTSPVSTSPVSTSPVSTSARPHVARRTSHVARDTPPIAPADVIGRGMRLEAFGSTCTVVGRDGGGGVHELGALRLRVPGRHNVLNALAAVAVGLEVGIPFSRIALALEEFHGAERRFQIRGEAGGVMLVDDYGHHPTEIAAVLAAARAGIDRRIIAVFQPHRYTRTAQLLDDFGRAFAGADHIVLTDIYAAGEQPIAGITVELLADTIRRATSKPVDLVKKLDDLPDAVATLARPGDFVLTLGAGSIGTVPERILDAIRQKGPRA